MALLLPCPWCRRRLRALGAAYAAALQTCQDNFDVVQQEELHAASTLCGLAAAMGYGPMAVGLDPALHQVLQQLWSRVEQQVSGSSMRVQACLAIRLPAATLQCPGHLMCEV